MAEVFWSAAKPFAVMAVGDALRTGWEWIKSVIGTTDSGDRVVQTYRRSDVILTPRSPR